MKILCFLPNYIGDVLMTTPALRLLKKYMPNSLIAVTLKPYLVELLDKNPNVDKIIVKHNRYTLARDVLKLKPDFVVLFRTTFFNSLLTFLSRAKFSVGMDEEFSRFFLKLTFKKEISKSYRCESITLSEHLLMRYLKTKPKVDPLDESKKIELYGYNDANIKTSIEKKLLKENIKDEKFIVISPCATRKTKMLSLQQYVYLIKSLLEKLEEKYYLILTGSKADTEFTKNITANINAEKLKSFVGELSLKELAYLLSVSSLFITPDSGPAYISEAVGAKTVIFFTSTLPDRYGPFSNNVKFLYHRVFCSPCYKNECKNYTCIKKFPVDELTKISLDFLKR